MLLATSLPELSGWDAVARLAVAGALGAAVGVERELREREAGVRTHLLVALGSCLFTVAGAYGFHDFGTRVDPTRIAAQIVTGIGFLGAGAIIREGISVRGLTTAGSLWIVAAIGMAAGAGYYWAAVAGTVLTLLALWPLRFLAYQALERFRPPERRLVVELRHGAQVATLLELVPGVRQVEVEDERDRRVVTLELADRFDERLVTTLADLDETLAVRWRR
ncbi:MAG TPA: MgtC/SapB family protein [Gaiellaceae bacterium]|nr:MgtC/SapB family protein [Gaiellaceae bacterium]